MLNSYNKLKQAEGKNVKYYKSRKYVCLNILHLLISINNGSPPMGHIEIGFIHSLYFNICLNLFVSMLYCAGVLQKDKRKRMSGVFISYLIYRPIFLNHHEDSQEHRVAKVMINFGLK